MKINEVIPLVENLVHTQASEDRLYSPTIRCTTVGSSEFPKIEVQVGPVLFSANNEEAAVYLPDLGVSSLNPENSLHVKLPLQQAKPEDIHRMVANTYGLGVTLENIRRNNLQPIGLANDKLYTAKDGKYFAYDFNSDFQLPSQTLLRVWEMDSAPECKWDQVPPIYCQPRLVEVMSSQLDIAARATINAPVSAPPVKSAEQELEESASEKLKTIFPAAKTRVQVLAGQNEQSFSLAVQDPDCFIEESGQINELGELVESSIAKGARQKISDYQRQALPIWQELTQKMVELHEQRFGMDV